MRVVNFRELGTEGPWRAGVLHGDVVQALRGRSGKSAAHLDEPALDAALAGGGAGGEGVERGKEIALGSLELGTPVLRPSKIVAAAANYLDHSAEMGAATRTIERQGFFLKAPTSLLPDGGSVALPVPGRRTDYEGELAAIIGRRASCVDEDEAWKCVLGYSCLLDISLRGDEDRGYRKSFDTFTPMGPALVTADELGDLGGLLLRTAVNGETRQEAKLSSMIVGVGELISWISSVMTLLPGDVIATGTPSGVGPLSAGDRVSVEITGVGTLEVGVVERSTAVKSPSHARPAGT